MVPGDLIMIWKPEATIYMSICMIRMNLAATLVSAENGKLTVEAVERMPTGFDIIFMYMSMPVMNGFEANRTIRSTGARER